MKMLLLLVFTSFVCSANASKYYFSSTAGDDSRTAVQAQNSATPWKTLAKLNSFFNNLLPGDQVLLRRGNVFQGSIIVSKSGTNLANIIIGTYGTGAQPVITGLGSLSWKSLGNNRYASQQLALSTINLVTRNNVPVAMGRWPNDDAPKSGYNIITTHTWDTISRTGSISSSSISLAPRFSIGAELVMRVKHFVIDKDHVTSYTKSSIKFIADNNAGVKYPPNDKYGYYLQNDSVFLDKQYEWWYSPKTRKLIVFSKTGVPSGVKASVESDLVTIAGFGYVTFDDIKFEGANNIIFNITGTVGNITIRNCNLTCSGRDGIYSSSPFVTIKNNIISHCLNRTIYSQKANAYIGYNTISNTAMLIGMGDSGDGNYIAINLHGSNSMIEHNKIVKTGYNGIYLTNGANYTTIQNNRIDSFCLLKNDGGGIYCYGRHTVSVGRKFLYNIISNGGVGKATDGADKPYTPNNRAEGIYCDQETSGISIKYNTLFNCYRGLFLNPGCNRIDAQWNTTYNNYLYEFYLNVGSNVAPGLDPVMAGNVIKHNTFVAVRTATITGYYMSQGWSMSTAGSIDSNYYARPLEDNKTMFNNGPLVSLASWKAAHPTFDKHSNKSPKSVTKTSDILLLYNENNTNKTVALSGKFMDMTAKTYSGSVILKPYTSLVLIRTSTTAARSATADSTESNNVAGMGDVADTSMITTALSGEPGIAAGSVSSSADVAGEKGVTAVISSSVTEPNEMVTQPDVHKPADFTIVPNPAVNTIRVQVQGLQGEHKATLSIQSINGAVLRKYPVTLSGSKIDVQISSLEAGMYILTLSGERFTSTKKFIKVY